MLKRDELAGPSCLTRAADDEPIFVLRANDELAPMAVRCWADYYYHKYNNAGTLTEARRRKWEEAYALADKMDVWRKERVVFNDKNPVLDPRLQSVLEMFADSNPNLNTLDARLKWAVFTLAELFRDHIVTGG